MSAIPLLINFASKKHNFVMPSYNLYLLIRDHYIEHYGKMMVSYKREGSTLNNNSNVTGKTVSLLT